MYEERFETLNKSVAIAIAAAMTATSAPTPLLASDLQNGGDFVSESPAAEADITEEACCRGRWLRR